MQAITPSVGRKVWYFENAAQTEPIDGTIVKVFPNEDGSVDPDSLVNVFIVEPGGNTRLIPAIRCQVEGYTAPHYRWMPYQLGQAAKAAAEVTAQTDGKK